MMSWIRKAWNISGIDNCEQEMKLAVMVRDKASHLAMQSFLASTYP